MILKALTTSFMGIHKNMKILGGLKVLIENGISSLLLSEKKIIRTVEVKP